MNDIQKQDQSPLFQRVVSILEQARSNVVRTVNAQMVAAYWLIGREIVEEEQQGEVRAAYGKRLIEELSRRLTERYGKGFSVPNLRNFRQFYMTFQNRMPEIHYPTGSELTSDQKRYPVGDELAITGKRQREEDGSPKNFHPNLGWSHYRALMRVENPDARDFYEIEAASNCWTKRQLERQIHSFYYERLLKSRDKAGMLQEANWTSVEVKPLDVIKDPYVLEFLDLPESRRLNENDLEAALISRLQDFLLELGAGFAFIGRQQRLTLEGDHFYADPVFYHVRLKCYVIIDLKTAKLTHGDLGQMQMYVNYFDREVCGTDDNPTVGLLLCAEKNDAVVRYVLGERKQHIFASRYRLELPDEQTLIAELQHEMESLHTDEGDTS